MTDDEKLELTYTQALWYAWGHYDGGGNPHLTLQDGWDFAELRKASKVRFLAQETHFFPSMLSDWEDFVKTITPVADSTPTSVVAPLSHD